MFPIGNIPLLGALQLLHRIHGPSGFAFPMVLLLPFNVK